MIEPAHQRIINLLEQNAGFITDFEIIEGKVHFIAEFDNLPTYEQVDATIRGVSTMYLNSSFTEGF